MTLKRNVDLQHDIGVRRSYWMMVSPVVKNNLKCDADFSLEVNRMYDIMDLIVPILIIVAIAVIILAFFKSMKEINDNKKAPLLSVPAKVSGKRTDIIKRNQPNAEYRRKPPVLQYRGLSLCAFTVHEPRLVAVIYSCLTICRYSGRLY